MFENPEKKTDPSVLEQEAADLEAKGMTPENEALEEEIIKIETEANEQESEWEFTEGKLTIADMMMLKIPLKEIIQLENVKLPIRWISLIKVVNHKLADKNKRLTTKTSIKDAIAAYTALFSKSFF